MKVLLTNDDGHSAPGIVLLTEVLLTLGHEPVIVAPSDERSGASRSRRSDVAIAWREVEGNPVPTVALDASPASCVVFAITSGLFPQFDLCLSGVNAGENLGRSLSVSGTFCAALEAARYAVPSASLSVETPGAAAHSSFDWHGREPLSRVLSFLTSPKRGDWVLANINFPVDADRADIALTQVSRRSLCDDYFDLESSMIRSKRRERDVADRFEDDIFALFVRRVIGVTLFARESTLY